MKAIYYLYMLVAAAGMHASCNAMPLKAGATFGRRMKNIPIQQPSSLQAFQSPGATQQSELTAHASRTLFQSINSAKNNSNNGNGNGGGGHTPTPTPTPSPPGSGNGGGNGNTHGNGNGGCGTNCNTTTSPTPPPAPSPGNSGNAPGQNRGTNFFTNQPLATTTTSPTVATTTPSTTTRNTPRSTNDRAPTTFTNAGTSAPAPSPAPTTGQSAYVALQKQLSPVALPAPAKGSRRGLLAVEPVLDKPAIRDAGADLAPPSKSRPAANSRGIDHFSQ